MLPPRCRRRGARGAALLGLVALGLLPARLRADPHIWHDYRPSYYGEGLVPDWEPVWDVARSTIIQPCHSPGLMPPSMTKGWGIVEFDWSNACLLYTSPSPRD